MSGHTGRLVVRAGTGTNEPDNKPLVLNGLRGGQTTTPANEIRYNYMLWTALGLHGMQEVAGSIPVASTGKFLVRGVWRTRTDAN